MESLQEFINEYSHLKSMETPFIYVDSDGRKYKTVEEAYKGGKEVAIKNINDSAIEDLKRFGIESKSDASKLTELLNHLFEMEKGKKSGTRTRKTYSNEEKTNYVKEWEQAEKDGKSLLDFSKEKGISKITLSNWINKLK